MELVYPVYVARPRPDRFEASIPWIEELAGPRRSSNASRVTESRLLEAIELFYERPAADHPALLPPDDLECRETTLSVEHRPAPNRPVRSIEVETTLLVGRLAGSELVHVWLPSVPGVCLAAPTRDDVVSTVQHWAREWLAETIDRSPDDLAEPHPSRLEHFEIDVEPPEPGPSTARPGGRLRRPRVLRQVATHETHRLGGESQPMAFGRDDLVESLVDAITGGAPLSIGLIGPSGVGKTALLEEAVRRAYDLQQTYQQRRDIWRTSGDRVVTARGEDQIGTRGIEAIFEELAERGDILILEDLLDFVRAGETAALDLGARLESQLERREIAVIAEATEETFDEVQMHWPGLAAQLQRLRVPELDADASLEVANDYVRSMEARAPVEVTPDGLEAALDFADRYDRRGVAPGKVIQLLRRCLHETTRLAESDGETGARRRLDAESVANVVHQRTGLPMRVLQPGSGRRADEIQASFERRVFDQPEATKAVVDLVASIEQDLTDPNRPHGSLLLIGPTGVGKTETAKALADEVFGDDDRLIRFDMSEFADPEAASRFVGTPDHPEGELTGRVRAQPFGVLLFDEIEKAHRNARDALLQLLEEGRMTDASGRTVDFAHTVVVLTSNLGDETERRRGDRERASYDREAAEDFFRPEFFNRLDRIVSYYPLEAETLRRIARRTLRDLLDRRGLRRLRVMVDFGPDLLDHLADGARDQTYGARTLSRRIERQLTAPLANRMARQRADEAALTRVRLEPDPEGGIELDLRSLEWASEGERGATWQAPSDELALFASEASRPLPPIPEGEEPTSEALASRFRRLMRAVYTLEDSEAIATIDADYEETLETINARADREAAVSHDLGERLRQCEIVRNGLDDLLNALEDRLLPDKEDEQGGFAMQEAASLEQDGRDELELPNFERMRRERLHEWAEDYTDLYADWIWLCHQIGVLLERSTDAASLVVRGLSGPYHAVLNHWYRLLVAFAESRDIEVAALYNAGDGWHVCREPSLPDEAERIVISAEHPGVGEAFRRLSGYTWAPDPSAGGRHALALTESFDRGTPDPNTWRESLRDVCETPDESEEDVLVEYLIEAGYLRDLRRGWRRTLPEQTGPSMKRFADTWILRRLTM